MTNSFERRRVVVTGMGLVSSLGHDVPSSWENLINGGTGVRDISETHLGEYTNIMLTRLGAPVVGFAFLDNPAFTFRPTERDEQKRRKEMGEVNLRKEKMNFHLSHEYGLEAAYQAIGPGPTGGNLLLPNSLIIDPSIVAHTEASVVWGTGIAGAAHFIDVQARIDAELAQYKASLETPKKVKSEDVEEEFEDEDSEKIDRVKASDMQRILIGRGAEIASMVFKMKRRVRSNLGECAASTDGIGEAADWISRGIGEVALAVGSEAAVLPVTVLCFERHKGAVSPSTDPNKSPRPLDKYRDGFVFGEGGSAVLLEEREHAIARGAKIYAEVIGWGDSGDGFDPVIPEEDGIQRSLDAALEVAGLRASDLDNPYINVHAPGTPADIVEATIATRNFSPKQAVAINSTKGSTGHALGSAGGMETIFTIKAINDQLVPPARNMSEPEEVLDGYETSMGKATQAEIVTGVKMSSGFGGHNATLILKNHED